MVISINAYYEEMQQINKITRKTKKNIFNIFYIFKDLCFRHDYLTYCNKMLLLYQISIKSQKTELIKNHSSLCGFIYNCNSLIRYGIKNKDYIRIKTGKFHVFSYLFFYLYFILFIYFENMNESSQKFKWFSVIFIYIYLFL